MLNILNKADPKQKKIALTKRLRSLDFIEHIRQKRLRIEIIKSKSKFTETGEKKKFIPGIDVKDWFVKKVET